MPKILFAITPCMFRRLQYNRHGRRQHRKSRKLYWGQGVSLLGAIYIVKETRICSNIEPSNTKKLGPDSNVNFVYYIKFDRFKFGV